MSFWPFDPLELPDYGITELRNYGDSLIPVIPQSSQYCNSVIP